MLRRRVVATFWIVCAPQLDRDTAIHRRALTVVRLLQRPVNRVNHYRSKYTTVACDLNDFFYCLRVSIALHLDKS